MANASEQIIKWTCLLVLSICPLVFFICSLVFSICSLFPYILIIPIVFSWIRFKIWWQSSEQNMWNVSNALRKKKPDSEIESSCFSAIIQMFCVAICHRKQILVHTVIEAKQTSFDIRSIYWHPREHYRMRTKAFATAHSLLLYHPHILILGKWMRSFAVCSAFIWYVCTQLNTN